MTYTGMTLSGRTLGGAFELGAVLGRGGMGEVYLAHHVRTGRPYAVKVLRTDRGLDDGAAERFRREAEVLASLGHAGIVAIHDFAETEDGLAFMVMDRLEGEDLDARIRRKGALPWSEAMRILSQAADALHAAHERGIVHRDLKPSNIFIRRLPGDEERAVVLDFGLAKMIEGEGQSLTASGTTLGTPLYMAPEQAAGRVVDTRTDVYALAAIAFEMVSGSPLFDAPTYPALVLKIMTAPPPPLSERATQPVPQKVDALLQRALAKSPDERPRSAKAFAAELADAVAEPNADPRRPLAATRSATAIETSPSDSQSSENELPFAHTTDAPGLKTSFARGSGERPFSASSILRRKRSMLAGLTLIAAALGVVGWSQLAGTSGASSASDAVATAATDQAASPGPPASARSGDRADEASRDGVPPAESATVQTGLDEASAAGAGSDAGPANEPTSSEDPSATDDAPEPAPSRASQRAPARAGQRKVRRRASAPKGSAKPPSSSPSQARASRDSAVSPSSGRGTSQSTSPRGSSAPAAAAGTSRDALAARAAAHTRRAEEIDAYLPLVQAVRSKFGGLAQGRRPEVCKSSLRQRIEAHTRDSNQHVAASAARLDDQLRRACEPFEAWASPDADTRARIRRFPEVVQRQKARALKEASYNEPRADAERIAAGIEAVGQLVERKGRFPCRGEALSALRRRAISDNSWAQSAGQRVLRAHGRICQAMGVTRGQLERLDSQLRSYLDVAEGNLRAAARTQREAAAAFGASP